MSEAIVTDTAPVMDTAPVETAPTTQTTETQDTQVTDNGDRASISETPTETPVDFTLPEEYKDKSWAEKVKSPEDAYKQIENLTALVGKKTIAPIDYETATTEEIAAHHATLAPADGVSSYQWGEGSMTEITGPMGDVFMEAGINAHQQKLISGKFDEIVSKVAGDQTSADTSADGYMAIMKESFGDDYETSVAGVEKVLKEFASDDDKRAFDAMDNKARSSVDRTIHAVSKKYEDRIATILKEHGVTETGAQSEGEHGGITVESKADQRAAVRAEMRELDGKPFIDGKMNELRKKLDSLL